MIKQQTRKQTGFTLIEVVVALALTSVMLMVLTDMLVSLVSLHKESYSASAVTQDGRYLLNRLEHDIRRASDVSVPETLGDTNDTLELTIDGLVYTYSLSDLDNIRLDTAEVNTGDTSYLSVDGGYNTPDSFGGTKLEVDNANERAYLLTGDNLYILDVSDKNNILNIGSYNTGVTVNDMALEGDYAYLTTPSDNAELLIINVSDPASPSLTNSVDLEYTEDALGVAVSDGYAYVGRTSGWCCFWGFGSVTAELYIVDISIPESASSVGSYEVGYPYHVNEIAISGNYAYLGNENGDSEIIVLDVSNKSNPSAAGLYNIGGTAVVTKLQTSNNNLFVSTANNGSDSEFLILNISDPASPSLTGSYETGVDVNGFHINDTTASLAMSSSGQQVSLLDISNLSAPSLNDSTTLGGGHNANAIAYFDNWAYVASSNTSQELTLVRQDLPEPPDSSRLNGSNTVISNLSFQRLGASGDTPTIKINLTVTSRIDEPSGAKTQNFTTTVGMRQ
ncbi:MAG: prepilin-type N-terminal cleavage/methylation domain-containing protein [Candidatus Saccharibacteria bacterium]|nr:prepilin-type N-terminal cleavage/methylation domain-containing protein [Candidatus Saccharibacteria bacterium]